MQLPIRKTLTPWLATMQIRNKFTLAFGMIFSLVAFVALVILLNIISITSEFQSFNDTERRLSALADDIRYYDATLTDAVRAYLIDPQDQAAYDRYFADAEALDTVIKAARLLATSAQDRQLFEDIDRVNLELVAIEETLLAKPDIASALVLYRGVYGDLKTEYVAYIGTFFDRQRANLQIREDQILGQLQQSLVLIVVLVGVLLLLTIAISISLSRDILTRLLALTDVTARFAEGELSARTLVTSQDELGSLGNAFNDMAARQQENIKHLDLARREAEDATRMKDLFLATMSHELRTPLNAMIGFLYLMIYSGQMDDDNVHMAERSLANTQRLLTLINNILDLSRIATGGLEIVPGAMSLRQVAAGLYNDLKLLSQDKALRLDLEVDSTLPDSINHDESRISQIVINLVSNAIKFTEKGTILLAFRQHEDLLIIQVADTGVGIPQSKQHLIFDDFFQVDATSTRNQQGAGLGLAIVKRLVLLMKGSIKLTSEPGQGSTFTVELPLELPRYAPGERSREAKNVFAKSMNGVNAQANLVLNN
ncbi:MAG: HAMP domain-containing protein [Armatimonadetes bacterium]|nr:HAMP domain-containing protein [Anaerolineae bacterium]